MGEAYFVIYNDDGDIRIWTGDYIYCPIKSNYILWHGGYKDLAEMLEKNKTSLQDHQSSLGK